MIYSEISQDCGRYKKIELIEKPGDSKNELIEKPRDSKNSKSELSDLDKDIWRAGGSSELVLEKWKIMTHLVEDYVLKMINKT